MLDRPHRLTTSAGFTAAVRAGRRAGGRTLVLHLGADAAGSPHDPTQDPLQDPARVGLVVSKAVGNAVVRNRVKRRLRHLARERVDSLPGSAVLVVRALPSAATASYAALGADFDTAMRRLQLARAGGPR